jgi:fibrillarin-like pre-rRNA processing protein
LDKNGKGILMVKSRSLNVSLKPKEVYKLVTDKLKKQGFKIEKTITLSPYVKDHAAFLISP